MGWNNAFKNRGIENKKGEIKKIPCKKEKYEESVNNHTL
jgi:hypothetical protein